MRAAAVLTGKHLTSAELAEKTNLELDDCRQFIGKLGESKCLEVARASGDGGTAAPHPSAPQQTAGHMITPPLQASAHVPAPAASAAHGHTPHPSAPSNSPSAAPALGLFGRIRSRLSSLGKAASHE